MSHETSKTEGLVIYRREGHVGMIVLNRAEKRNAMDLRMWEALDEAIHAAGQDREARVILVMGEGMVFCAGLDLSPQNELFAEATRPANASQKVAFFETVRRLQKIYTRLDRLIKPTIALIHGHCLGAGMELALCCDIRLCSAETLFAFPEAKLGFITDVGGLQRLNKVVGRGHTREIAFRGHRFDAPKALAIHLVNEVYPDKEALYARGMDMAEEIASNPPLAVQGAKEVLFYDEEVGLEESLLYNAARSSMIVPSEDLLEAVSSYVQKRKGTFKGA